VTTDLQDSETLCRTPEDYRRSARYLDTLVTRCRQQGRKAAADRIKALADKQRSIADSMEGTEMTDELTTVTADFEEFGTPREKWRELGSEMLTWSPDTRYVDNTRDGGSWVKLRIPTAKVEAFSDHFSGVAEVKVVT